jgi:YVTN family beta-propeller protein
MTRAHAIAVLAAAATACHLPARAPTAPPRLADEGEVWFYLQPPGGDAERLEVQLSSAAAVRRDGGADVPLSLRLARISRQDAPGQRLLAWGRVPAGSYEGLRLGVAKATLAGDEGEGVAELLVPKEPALVAAPFAVGPGKAAVVSLDLRAGGSVQQRYAFSPSFSAGAAPRPFPQLAGYCSNASAAGVTAFDRVRRTVGEVVPTGARPRGLALDPAQLRLYVAEADQDLVEVFDIASGAPLVPLRLQAGDRPAEIALAADGRTLLATNEGSNSVSFLDLRGMAEVARVPVGDRPRGLVLDRSGQRAYVLDVRSNAITVVDVPNRAAVTTVPTDAEPLRAAVSRDGSRLYVVYAGSPYLAVLSLPELAVVSRIFVGLGAQTVLVDPRSDLVYVGGDLGDRIVVVDPMALVAIDFIDVPGEVSWLAIADPENALFALVSDRRHVTVVDLPSRGVVGAFDVGDDPYQLVLSSQRR